MENKDTDPKSGTLGEINKMQLGKDSVVPKSLTVIVVSITKVTTTKNGGKMQYALVKDKENNKNSIMVYHHLNKLKPFSVYTLTKVCTLYIHCIGAYFRYWPKNNCQVKRTPYVDENGTLFKLQTTSYTQVR